MMEKTPLIIDFMEKLIEAKLPATYWNGKTRTDVCELIKYVIENELKLKSDDAFVDKEVFNTLRTKYKLRNPIVKFFNGNYYEVINDIYPNRFKRWQLVRTTWTQTTICEAMDWLVEDKCGGRRELTKDDFVNNGMESLYNKFGGSIDRILTRAFKEIKPVKSNDDSISDEELIELERKRSRVRNMECVVSDDELISYIMNNIQTGAYDILKEKTGLYERSILIQYAAKSIGIKGATNKQDFCKLLSRVIKIADAYQMNIKLTLGVVCLHEMGYLYDPAKYNEYSRKEFINNRTLCSVFSREEALVIAQSLTECRFSPSIKQTTPYSKLLIDFKKKANLEGMVRNLINMAKVRNRVGKSEYEFVERVLRNTFINSHYGKINYKLSERFVADGIHNTMKTVKDDKSIKAIYENVKIKYGI